MKNTPQRLLEFAPMVSTYSFRHFQPDRWLTGITPFQPRLGWYLACIISFFPQFSVVKSSIKLDWACLSQPVLECSGEITLKGTRPWLSGRLAHALMDQLLTWQKSCDVTEGSGHLAYPSPPALFSPWLKHCDHSLFEPQNLFFKGEGSRTEDKVESRKRKWSFDILCPSLTMWHELISPTGVR